MRGIVIFCFLAVSLCLSFVAAQEDSVPPSSEPQQIPCKTTVDCLQTQEEDPCAFMKCVSGLCKSLKVSCDDGDPSTRDYCDRRDGCVHERSFVEKVPKLASLESDESHKKHHHHDHKKHHSSGNNGDGNGNNGGNNGNGNGGGNYPGGGGYSPGGGGNYPGGGGYYPGGNTPDYNNNVNVNNNNGCKIPIWLRNRS
eukprot:TRINITY_DN3658_c0_g1_i1.p1 TRINITY_DN3658_c0_g1~~TRINITY_DN3658_c0_g1_i1.p1  ORF type:complete len:197 (-),score=37.61 TRINITY_DN3658_c0_g1_i1:96-686(-)